jgi:magnesium transporter
MNKEKLILKADLFLKNKQEKELRQLLSHQDFHVIAQVIDGLPRGRRKTFAILPPEKQAEVAMVVSDMSKRQIFPRLADDMIARFLHFNDEDDATDILQYLTASRRALILSKMKDEKKAKIEKLLKFGSETAGGLMDLNFILTKPTFTQKEVMDKIQRHVDLQKQIPVVLEVDEAGRAMGVIPHRNLLFLSPTSTVEDLAQSLPTVSHRTDRERVMQKMSRMRSEVLCVVDDQDLPLGVIHLRDLLKVAQAEATEDIYRFAGVDVEEHALDPAISKVKRRYNWLIINLATAFLAASVVGLFQGTIEKMALLAVYMPIVAGMGGNAATQSLAVAVRGLALGELDRGSAKKVITREAMAGMMNGLITGIIAAGTAVAFRAPPLLGAVLCFAMICNMFVAGFFGTLIPLILKRCNIDPATASSVFVTTCTDICGFFVYLGLGTLLLT